MSNIKVVLVSNSDQDLVTIMNRNLEILGSYPNTEKSKGEAVFFTRMYLSENAEKLSIENKAAGKFDDIV